MKTAITIDGPAGSGKSTVARHLAESLGIIYLDTGSLYRAMAWQIDQLGIDPEADSESCERAAKAVEVTVLGPGRVAVGDVDVSGLIRNARIDGLASRVAAIPGVRAALLDLQRGYAAEHDCVLEGRDTGTVICPDATLKIWLTADPAERSQRIAALRGEEAARLIAERDEREATRTIAPMRPAPDAVMIDATDLSIEAVVYRIKSLLRQRQEGAVH